MSFSKADIIAQLQKEILPLQGFRPAARQAVNLNLGPIEQAFPGAIFPTGAVHEFITSDRMQAAATSGFMAGLLSSLMRNDAASIWISSSRTLFPPALRYFGITPDKMLFIDLRKERDILWAVEEALKCDGLAAVVGELSALSFTASRRLQLAVEKSRVTGLILRKEIKQLNTTACVSRWKITSLPSETPTSMPGLGFPRWKVELLKVRNGKPGQWDMEWKTGKLQPVPQYVDLPEEQWRMEQIKTA